jgi:hypothetical protein
VAQFVGRLVIGQANHLKPPLMEALNHASVNRS